jgi:hypothetical protein
MAKIKTVGTIREFTSGEYKVKERQSRQKRAHKALAVTSSIAIPLAVGSPLGLIMGTTRAFAETPQAVPVNATEWAGEKSLEMVAHALDPIVDVLVALSFPVASVVIVGGCFWFMFGNSERAWRTIQNASLGYVLIQMSPLILNVLKNIGGSL